jgi:glycosylphosphatidylinositol transamidase (GPIT) subunit GPI8
MCKQIGGKLDEEPWYEHVPKSVEAIRGSKVTVLWNQQLQTDRNFPNNKSEIRDNEKGTCVLIYVATSGDRNVLKKGAGKILKYKDLTIEIERMWKVKTKR